MVKCSHLSLSRRFGRSIVALCAIVCIIVISGAYAVDAVSTSLSSEIRTDNLPTFDSHTLKQWAISESLPPNRIVPFLPQSLWEYRWYIVGVGVIIWMQSTVIVNLVVERRRLHRAGGESRPNWEELTHVTRVSTLGALTTSIAHELNQPLGAILSNAEAAEMFLKADPPALDEVRYILIDIVPGFTLQIPQKPKRFRLPPWWVGFLIRVPELSDSR